MLIRTNKNMIDLLKKAKIKREEVIKISTDNLSKIMSPNFKDVHDCIIIDMNNEIKVENVNFKRILSMFRDRTGYEASCNEIRINDYVDYSDEVAVLQLAEIIMDTWKYKLKTEYPQYRFCIILSFSEGYVTMRFHVIRENESSWLKTDLDEYKDEAIMVQEF
ncbi:hypothetical protein [Inconstantimicrobium mannanitabidum]|uniref:Uncharacterized protein n=1 Tax=Inconstantimicrobium mannanitabidum TaxID=1604901 RepID=A0ACB5RCX6_9CLOT|nr:hypothetical protein [Clostridium sp. TW13]GKX67000.1 hypothetical protein rsdtw13_22580 [Clostridium sp. TW13]